MTLLTLGVLLWAFVHLFPSLMPGPRASLMARLGENPYKGLFALDIVISILLMVFGWRSADVAIWYNPPLADFPYPIALGVLAAFVLMGAANAPTNIKRFLRHPMLTGIIVWGRCSPAGQRRQPVRGPVRRVESCGQQSPSSRFPGGTASGVNRMLLQLPVTSCWSG